MSQNIAFSVHLRWFLRLERSYRHGRIVAVRIGATRHSNPGGDSKLVPPVIRMSQIAVPRQSKTGATLQSSRRLVPPFSRAREHLNRCHPSVEVETPNWCHPPVEYGRTRRIGATRQLNSGGEGEWCHPRVLRRRGVPALGLVFRRQTAAVGAGLASLLADSAAEYPAWLILLKLA